MIEFIFMLTHSDRTVPNARAVYDEIRDCDLRYVGFKDIGLPIAELKALSAAIRTDGREVMLEVVSEAKDDDCAFDGKFAGAPSVPAQIDAVLEAARD